MRNLKIDILRLFFCIMIVVYHSNKYVGNSVYFAKGWYISVEFFFLVSGALLIKSMTADSSAQNLKESHPAKVFFRKVKNVWLLYIISYLLAFVITQMVNHVTVRESIKMLCNSVGRIFLFEMTGMDTLAKFSLQGSWFISAMLFATIIVLCIYEVSGKWFFQVVAPVSVIVFLGYFNQKYGRIHQTHDWTLFIYSGTVRAVAEMLLGAICYRIGSWMRGNQYTLIKKRLLLALEAVCYVTVIVASYFFGFSGYDFIYLILLALGVTLSFGIETEYNAVFKGLAWLGKTVSLPVYLNHLWLIYLIKDIDADIVTKIALFILSLLGSCLLVLCIKQFVLAMAQKYLLYRRKVLKRELDVAK